MSDEIIEVEEIEEEDEVKTRNRRLKLHNILLEHVDYAYYAPPDNLTMNFPCVVYHKTSAQQTYSDNRIYTARDLYRIKFLDKTIDSEIHEDFMHSMMGIRLLDRFVLNNVQHTVFELYY